jgi:predicted membrane metal-binding protein
MRLEVGFGPGFWLNVLGHAALVALAGWQLAKK